MTLKAKAKLASEGPSTQRVSPFWSPPLLQYLPEQPFTICQTAP